MLTKVQKLATLQITGGFKKSPNLTLDILAGLMPISVSLNFKAIMSTLRLKIDGNWVGNYNVSHKLISHARYLDNIIKKSKLEGRLHLIDRTSTTNLTVNYTKNYQSLTLPYDNNIVSIFTDGSLITNGRNKTGAGFIIYDGNETLLEQSFHLGSQTTINQCEMLAIVEAAEKLLHLDTTNRTIAFFTYSLMTLHKLGSSSSNQNSP